MNFFLVCKKTNWRLVFETVGDYIVPNEVREEIKDLWRDEHLLLNQTFAPNDRFYKNLKRRMVDHYDQIFEKWHACGGASLDPTFKKEKDWQRTLSDIDKTDAIKDNIQKF